MFMSITEEPNNWGGQVPGEDCAIAHLGGNNLKWYDVPCYIRGFAKGEHQFSFNPLCEHEPFPAEPFEYELEGTKEVNKLN